MQSILPHPFVISAKPMAIFPVPTSSAAGECRPNPGLPVFAKLIYNESLKAAAAVKGTGATSTVFKSLYVVVPDTNVAIES